MGFLRRLFGGKKHHNPPPSDATSKPNTKDKKTWSFVKHSTRYKPNTLPTLNNNTFDPSTSSAPFTDSLDANKHAIAVAAATAVVAEAALAAAHAAAEVVRLTSATTGAASSRPATAPKHRRVAEQTAAAVVKIQSAFRGYLARRALRALKALVKLQALVRGHIVRKQTADMLRRMQTLVKLQSRARATRGNLSDTNMHSFKSSLSHYPVPENYQHSLRAYSTKFDGSVLKRCSSNANFRDIDLEKARFGSHWLDSWMEENSWSQTRDASLKNGHIDDEKSDKILEVDTWKPHLDSHHSSGTSSFQASSHHYLPSDYNNDNFVAYESPSKRSSKALNSSLSSREVPPLGSLKFYKGKEEAAAAVAALRNVEDSPQAAFSASSRLGSGARRGPFTPTKSECAWSLFSGYPGHPNYMANTESSKAKVRSHSAPRQRMEFERYGHSTRRSLWEAGPSSDRDSDFRTNIKAYAATTSSSSSLNFNRIGSANLR